MCKPATGIRNRTEIHDCKIGTVASGQLGQGSDRDEEIAKGVDGMTLSKAIEDDSCTKFRPDLSKYKEQPREQEKQSPSTSQLEVSNLTLEQCGSSLYASWDAPFGSKGFPYLIMLYCDGHEINEKPFKTPATSRRFNGIQLSKEYFCEVWVKTLDGSGSGKRTYSNVVVTSSSGVEPPFPAPTCDSPTRVISSPPQKASPLSLRASPPPPRINQHNDDRATRNLASSQLPRFNPSLPPSATTPDQLGEQEQSAAQVEVSNVTLEQCGSDLRASWVAPVGGKGLLYFVMLYCDGQEMFEKPFKTPAKSKTFSDIQPAKEYFCGVWAETSDGCGTRKKYSDLVTASPVVPPCGVIPSSLCTLPPSPAKSPKTPRPAKTQPSNFAKSPPSPVTTPGMNKAITRRDKETEVEADPDDVRIPANKVTVFKGHKGSVCRCSWSPTCDLLASCSEDPTVRIWNLTAVVGTGASSSGLVLQHGNRVWSLDWNPDGTLLATGSHDGSVRVWTKDGHLLHHLSQHRGAIYALKWNKQGNYIASGSLDKSTMVWDAQSGKLKQEFCFHAGSVNDVDWQDDVCFASCSDDKNIHVCKVGRSKKTVKTFNGHSDRVYAVEWDPSKRFLASCSRDNTVKIWSMKKDDFVHDLRGHSERVVKIKWSPDVSGSQIPNQRLLLASASWDYTVRLWEPVQGVCLHTLERHQWQVTSIAFSPDGRFLANGSEDKCVNIWNTQSGQLVRSYKGNKFINDVCWNATGTKVGAGVHDGTVKVLDLRK